VDGGLGESGTKTRVGASCLMGDEEERIVHRSAAAVFTSVPITLRELLYWAMRLQKILGPRGGLWAGSAIHDWVRGSQRR